MTWLICGAVAVVAFSVGFIVSCLLGAAKFSDMLSANEHLQQEVNSWKKKVVDLHVSMTKHNQ